jgi:hypothetical protein
VRVSNECLLDSIFSNLEVISFSCQKTTYSSKYKTRLGGIKNR